MIKNRIYLDNNASTPLDPRVLQKVVQHLQDTSGNPSSVHGFGREARKIIMQSRDQIAACLKVRPEEIVFTSGGTEGANMIIRGLLSLHPNCHVISSASEHSAVYKTLKSMEGFNVSFLEPGKFGAVTPEDVKAALKPQTKLITLMAANNETGVKTDIEVIAAIAQEANIPFFVDAVALLGKEPLTIPAGVSAMCFSGQKFHAPKGVGFNFIRRNLKMAPLITGGDQEHGKRAGTENVAAIAGLAEAVSILFENPASLQNHMSYLRDKFEARLKASLPKIIINGEGPRIANTSNICFEGTDGETLASLLDLQGIAASHGSACASGALEPSRILLNMGLPLDRVRSSLRFSVSRFTTEEEIDEAVKIIIALVKKIN